MPSHYDAWRFWLGVVNSAGTIAIGVYVWLVTRDRVTNKRITDLDKKMGEMLATFKEKQSAKCTEHQRRTSELEVSIQNFPTHDDIGAVHDRITSVKGGVDELAGLIKGMRDNVTLLVDHHLRGE